jgi:hypothetical protein
MAQMSFALLMAQMSLWKTVGMLSIRIGKTLFSTVMTWQFVEVMSLNDQLDGQQEDWLNVLNRIGNARVCKFGKRKNASKKTAAAK